MKLRVWEGHLRRRDAPIRGRLIPAEDGSLELRLLPAQRRAQDWTPYLVLKDALGSGQARRLKGIVSEGEGYKMSDSTEDRIVNLGKEEYRAVNVY